MLAIGCAIIGWIIVGALLFVVWGVVGAALGRLIGKAIVLAMDRGGRGARREQAYRLAVAAEQKKIDAERERSRVAF